MADVECVVVGGGVAGLMIALRLALAGIDVVLFEKERLGSGSTIGNHGTIHSGAFFAELHPEIARLCQEARQAYLSTFAAARISAKSSWYFGRPQRLATFRTLWAAQNIAFKEVRPDAYEELIRADRRAGLLCFAIEDLNISSRRLVVELAQRCSDAGASIVVGAQVRRVLLRDREALGVAVGLREVVTAHHVIICTGFGTKPLLDEIGSKVRHRLKSRLDLMVGFRNMDLRRAVFCLDYGGPTIAPSSRGVALASRYGGEQVWTARAGKWPVSLQTFHEVSHQVRSYLRDGVVDLADARAWVCSKTEVAAGGADPWGVEPGYAVIDHRSEDGISGLWTVLPGKMTLAMHASRALIAQLTGHQPDLRLPQFRGTIQSRIEALVADEPWAMPDPTPNGITGTTDSDERNF